MKIALLKGGVVANIIAAPDHVDCRHCAGRGYNVGAVAEAEPNAPEVRIVCGRCDAGQVPLDGDAYGAFIIPILDTGYDAAQALRSDEECSAGHRLLGGRFVAPEPTAQESALAARERARHATVARMRGKSVGQMSLPDLRALVHVLAEMNGIEVEP